MTEDGVFVTFPLLGQIQGVELEPVMALEPAVLTVFVQPCVVALQLPLGVFAEHTAKFRVQGEAEQIVSGEGQSAHSQDQ